jgi:uncharacterized membrane protein YgcG
MELLIAVGPILLGVLLAHLLSRWTRWRRRQAIQEHEAEKERLRGVFMRYRAGTMRRSGATSHSPSSSREASSSSAPVAASPWDSFVPAGESVPPPSIGSGWHGGGGELSGGGASGGWDLSSSGSSDSSASWSPLD